jgi:hypothetical protein
MGRVRRSTVLTIRWNGMIPTHTIITRATAFMVVVVATVLRRTMWLLLCDHFRLSFCRMHTQDFQRMPTGHENVELISLTDDRRKQYHLRTKILTGRMIAVIAAIIIVVLHTIFGLYYTWSSLTGLSDICLQRSRGRIVIKQSSFVSSCMDFLFDRNGCQIARSM